jgi:hypothetical protein
MREPKKVYRPGKTKRDLLSGSHARCIANKQSRAYWQNEHKRENGLKDFPWATCNGHRNRYHGA